MDFKKRHEQEIPFLICNVWDVASAKVAQNQNYQAIGTSSGAIATMLGYNDGEEISFRELEYIIKRISKSVNLPLSVDLEAGYSRKPLEIAENILRLSDLGIVGVNIEDSIVNQERKLVDAGLFSKILEEVCTILNKKNAKIFINVRTDTFLLNIPNAIIETTNRARMYHNAGAHGLFVPCIESEKDIETVVKGITLPLNVMCMPKLPGFEILKQLGVTRVSMGNFVFNRTIKLLENEMKEIQKNNSFQSLFKS